MEWSDNTKRQFFCYAFIIKFDKNLLFYAALVSEYLMMPPMHKVDDFDACFLQIPDGAKATYCSVTSLIKPNESSPIWQIVQVSEIINQPIEFKCAMHAC